MTTRMAEVEALDDRLTRARARTIADDETRSPLPIRLIERRRLEIMRELVGDVRGLELAEIGSGVGRVLRMFREARLTAIDASSAFLDAARKNLAGYDARFIQGEVDKLDLPAASFDRIVCAEHTQDPEIILATVARLLRPYGVAVITVPSDPLILGLEGLVRRAAASRAPRGRVGGDATVQRWTPKVLERVLARHFRVTERRSAPFDALPIRACFRCVRRG